MAHFSYCHENLSEMLTLLLYFSATTSEKNADCDAVTRRMEVLVASIKRRSQRLYKDTDGSKGRARIRRKIREEKAILSSVVDKYNSMDPDTDRIVFDSLLSDETVWPWQLSHGGMFTNQLTISYDLHCSTKPIMLYFRSPLKNNHTYNWLMFHNCIPDSVDLRTKRKAFDSVMAIRRLEEEKKIVVAEMAKHWKSLSTRADTLNEMSCLNTSEALKSMYLGKMLEYYTIIIKKKFQGFLRWPLSFLFY